MKLTAIGTTSPSAMKPTLITVRWAKNRPNTPSSKPLGSSKLRSVQPSLGALGRTGARTMAARFSSSSWSMWAVIG
jgi:hypothetical protein